MEVVSAAFEEKYGTDMITAIQHEYLARVTNRKDMNEILSTVKYLTANHCTDYRELGESVCTCA